MKSRPIIFSSPMVNAILAGTKTQTRRVVKPQPTVIHAIYSDASIATERIFRSGDQRIHCPHGMVGDHLWVRETWAPAREGLACGGYRSKESGSSTIAYRADGASVADDFKWRSSAIMPRWASRITLEITDVRCQQLQAIYPEECAAEGCKPWPVLDVPTQCFSHMTVHEGGLLVSFGKLWDSINAASGYPWASNPWVWVLAFRRVA